MWLNFDTYEEDLKTPNNAPTPSAMRFLAGTKHFRISNLFDPLPSIHEKVVESRIAIFRTPPPLFVKTFVPRSRVPATVPAAIISVRPPRSGIVLTVIAIFYSGWRWALVSSPAAVLYSRGFFQAVSPRRLVHLRLALFLRFIYYCQIDSRPVLGQKTLHDLDLDLLQRLDLDEP